jgi:nucleotide-binding universal stress UspA family protein
MEGSISFSLQGQTMSELFNKILIATDGSKYTQGAIRKGIEIARLHKAKVYALYVIDTRALITSNGMPAPENIYTILQDEGRDAVQQVKDAAGGVDVEPVVLSGHPSSVIVKFAKEHGVDLIVTGTLGKSGIEELLLGSVADKVIRTATCPVLVVKST